MTVPAAWSCSVTNSGRPGLVTVQVSGSESNGWVMLVTFGPREPGSDSRAKVTEAEAKARGRAEEAEVEIKELSGKAVRGYYFSMTDRAPRPGEFKCLTQGVAEAGEAEVAFTVLSNERGMAVEERALEVVGSVVYKKAASGGGRGR